MEQIYIDNSNSNKMTNYNHVIKNLQDYMLNENIMNKATEDMLQQNKKNNFNKNQQKSTVIPNETFLPKEVDSLFWCFYIMKNSFTNYDMLNVKNIVVEKKIKIDYIEKIRQQKILLKTYKFSTLTDIENKLANEDKIDISTFLTLCLIENLNIIITFKKSYYELLTNDSNNIFILTEFENKVYGINTNINCSDKIQNIKASMYKIENINKPIKSISVYKVDELIEICNKLSIDVINKTTNKNKNKKELYESIIQYF